MNVKNPEDSALLVTGGAGYLGSRFVRDVCASEAAPARVRILDNLHRTSPAGLFGLPSDGPILEFFEDDLLDPIALRAALEGVDTVVHLAAVASTPFSFDHPASTRYVNQWGTAHLVEEAIAAGVRRFILASSASVYGPGGPFRETSACKPIGPYSQSKRAAEEAVLAAGDRMDVTVLRFAMLYGQAPAVRYDAVPNRFVFLAATGRPLPLFGNGRQRRPLVHVADASNALALCLGDAEGTKGRVLNVAAANWAIRDIVDIIRSLRPFTRVVDTDQDVRTHWSLEVTSNEIRTLGWQPTVRLDDGLGEMLEVLGPFAARAVPAVES